MCKSQRQNGICTEYGEYCAKAHSRCEIRSLVDIFGENWKRHYDLSSRLCFHRDVFPGSTVISTKRYQQYGKRVGRAEVPKNYQMLDVNLFALYLLEKQSSMRDESQICLERKLEVELWSDSDDNFEDLDTYALKLQSPYDKTDLLIDGDVMSYSPSHNAGNGYAGLTNIWEQEFRSQYTDSLTQAISNFSSPAQNDYESLLYLASDRSMLCGKGSSQLGMSGLNSDGSDDRSEFNYDHVLQNWFLSSCRASDVFANRLL